MSYSGSFRFQRYDVNKTIKNIRFFGYAGGMVTQVHPEKLNDGQSVLLENVDVISGNTFINRGAYSQINRCDTIKVTSLEEIKEAAISMDNLKTYTMDSLKNSILTYSNTDSEEYYTTMDGLKNDEITFDNLKSYTMNVIKTTGVSGLEVGNSQGIFRYYSDKGYIDILAIKGKLYTIENENTYVPLTIQGMTNFQTSRPIEGIQYRDKLYIATGSGIVVYDGTTASAITAYQPNGLEALYIGTNAYATNPSSYLSDDLNAVSDTIVGVVPDNRYGIPNTSVTFTAYIEQVSGDSLEYLFETKLSTDTSYATGQDWSTSKVFTTSFGSTGNYMIRVSMRKTSATSPNPNPILSQYVLPRFTVNETYPAKAEADVNFSNISTCNRIFVHYNQLCVYGDTTNPDYLYMSHVDNFTFFPRSNIMSIVDPLRGKLQNIVLFKNFLVCFTDSSIQQITGNDPTNYAINPVHMSLGTIYPYSVQVMQNYIAFVGNNNGIYILKTFNYASTNDKMNVQRIDMDIKDLIVGHVSESQRILSCIYNDQYYLYIQTPTDNYIYRFYYNLNLWVRDKVDFQFKIMTTIDNIITLVSVWNGIVYQLKRNIYFDGVDNQFNIHVISKDYDMNMPHHRKKMKQFQLMAELTSLTVMTISVYGDNNLLTTEYISHDPVQNSDADKLKVTTSGAFRYTKVDITIPVTEEVKLLGYAFIFKLNTPK